jgi:hypothetical protein
MVNSYWSIEEMGRTDPNCLRMETMLCCLFYTVTLVAGFCDGDSGGKSGGGGEEGLRERKRDRS